MNENPETSNRVPVADLAVDACSEMACVLLMHAVGAVLDGCGNSYANSYTEQWLTHAKSLGAYHGRVVGTIIDLSNEWESWLDANGGLPDFPNIPQSATPGGQSPASTKNPSPGVAL